MKIRDIVSRDFDKETSSLIIKNDFLAIKRELRRCNYIMNDDTPPSTRKYLHVGSILFTVYHFELDGYVSLQGYFMNSIRKINSILVATRKTDMQVKKIISELFGEINNEFN